MLESYGTRLRTSSGDKIGRKQKTHLQMMFWNVEGLINVLCNHPFLIPKNLDIVIFVETLSPSQISFRYLKSICTPAEKYDREGRPSGGIAMLVKANYETEVVSQKPNALHLYLPQRNTPVLAFYFKPRTDVSQVIDKVTTEVANAKPYSRTIIVGDFN